MASKRVVSVEVPQREQYEKLLRDAEIFAWANLRVTHNDFAVKQALLTYWGVRPADLDLVINRARNKA